MAQLQSGISDLRDEDSVNPIFKRIGHFSLHDNMESNLQARELKTVYVDC